MDINESKVIQAVTKHRNSLKNPSLTKTEYLQSLANQRLIQTTQILKEIL